MDDSRESLDSIAVVFVVAISLLVFPVYIVRAPEWVMLYSDAHGIYAVINSEEKLAFCLHGLRNR